ncbi:MAG TPA: DUF3267 domain-containing protein [Planococcus sp. (in: firmicutes)]|nr:DUF3267 domain-containing protein [Planococcus sp. (in: firmicutes)]
MKPDRIIELKMEEVAPKALWFNVILLIVFAVFFHIFSGPLSLSFSFWGILLFIVGYLLLIVLHELFHLIGFLLFAKVKLSSLNYGVLWEMGVAYATTSTPVQTGAMRKVLLLPFWTTAVVPTIIGFWIDSQVLVLLGAMLAAGAAGDFLMYRELLKEKKEAWIVDDPELPRLLVYNEYPE